MKTDSRILIRKASFSDIEFLWYLKNQPNVYKYFRKPRKIPWKEHINWILPVLLGQTNKEIFIIQNSKVPVGQIRFDYKNHQKIEISISILKEFRGKDIATKALRLAIKKIREQKTAKILVAEIHKKNLSSVRLFEKLNFKLRTKKMNWLEYILEP